jgi:hypothetical protein
MKKEKCLILSREDIKPGLIDYSFYDISPYAFRDDVQRKMEKYPVVLFINDSDDRTRILKNDYGKFGFIVPVNKMRPNG